MNKKTIYLVNANIDYESGKTIRAYEDKSQAEAFAESCRSYERENPIPWGQPDRISYMETWTRNHPLGDEASVGTDSYSVVETELIERGPTIDLNDLTVNRMIDTYVKSFGPLPDEIMANDIFYHINELIKESGAKKDE